MNTRNIESKETAAVLQRSIEHLKSNIQYIIDKKKSISDTTQIGEFDKQKKVKLAELKKLTDKLKECVKKEKEDKKKANDLKAISRAIGSLEFAGAKRSKSYEAMEKAMRAKESRESAKKEYEEYLTQLEQYNKQDPQSVPGYLFLYERIINAYGLCPFIRIDTDGIEKSRKDWLRRQNDKGELYYKVYNQIVNKEDIMECTEVYNRCETEINNFIQRNLTDKQIEMWKECRETASEYVGCAIKTKRIKEKFKMVVHTLSLLFAETDFSLHEYLTLKYTFNFVINELKSKNCNKIDKHIQVILSGQFNELLENFKVAKDSLEQKTIYTTNIYRNLQNEMYLFMMNKKTFGEIQSISQNKVVQQGKYFKRWTALSEEEKIERFESFSTYYIQKNMVREKLLDDQDAPNKAAKLLDVIKKAFLEKTLIYRDFKWDTKTGIISKVICLRYDQETGDFYINKKVNPKKKETQTKSKKKASVRTIVTKRNSRLINEEVLCFIVEKLQKRKDCCIEKTDKEECIERIKNKLNLKKVTTNDKVLIGEKYEEIFNVVATNQE